MKYAKSNTGVLVIGVIFYFEAGDEEIATDVMELVEVSEKSPTSIVWNGECLTSAEASHQLVMVGLEASDWLGVRFTLDDLSLLKDVLEFFKENYPPLSRMVAEIEGELFVAKH